MANVSSKEKREQVLALGRLGWTLRRTMHEQDGEIAVRRILGLLSLTRRHGAPPRPASHLRQVDPLIRALTHYRDVIERMAVAKENHP